MPQGRRRHTAWAFDERPSMALPDAARRADADYVAAKIRRVRYAAPVEERVAYLERWRALLRDEVDRAKHAREAGDALRAALRLMPPGESWRPHLEAAISTSDAMATVTTFSVRRVGFVPKDLVVARVPYRSRGVRQASSDARWQVLAEAILTDDEIARVLHPKDRDRDAAKHKVAKARSQRLRHRPRR